MLLGAVFHSAVNEVLIQLEDLGRYALLLLFAARMAFAAANGWKRRQFLLQTRMDRISIDEPSSLLESGAKTTIVDVRCADQRTVSHESVRLLVGWKAGAPKSCLAIATRARRSDQRLRSKCDAWPCLSRLGFASRFKI